MTNVELRQTIKDAIAGFNTSSLKAASIELFRSLGYTSEKTVDFGSNPQDFITSIEEATHSQLPFDREKVFLHRWKECAFLFQLTNDEIPALAYGQQALAIDTGVNNRQIDSFIFIAIALNGNHWTRTDLAKITREINRRFPMPVITLFRYDSVISLAVIDRRQHLRDSSRDVIDSRITVIKDVRITDPHTGHMRILEDLAFQNIGERHKPTNFRELYLWWINTLSTQTLNRNFYKELSYWYFWATKEVSFPKGAGKDDEQRNAVSVIRMLTRLIFVWFIKERGLVRDELFDPTHLDSLLRSNPKDRGKDGDFYLAVLQNLFFATLNVEMGSERTWASTGAKIKSDRMVHSLYRHKELFRDPDKALSLFKEIPFMNGGLFECLDRELTEQDFKHNPDLHELATEEGNGKVLRVDGFSRRKEAQPYIPNKLFFNDLEKVDLNQDLGTRGKGYEVRGLIDILRRYKFTVEENTPVEEEVALDPELLGKVFENLLASYNEETSTTARKQSGSYYTPREIVDFMVDEALSTYFDSQLQGVSNQGDKITVRRPHVAKQIGLPVGNTPAKGELELISENGLITPESATEKKALDEIDPRLRVLLSYEDVPHQFATEEVVTLIASIERLKLLDPACGSGAFLMGALQKLVHILRKLDPDNIGWKRQNRKPLEEQRASAKSIPDPSSRGTKLEEAESALEKFDSDFANPNHADYTRKLYLIEKCIHGVDIQPIAVQIAKLRFFIALVVSQEVDKRKANWGITALPNLETKIVAANSLVSIDRQITLRNDAVDVIEKELSSANEFYFAARTARTKNKWRNAIYRLRDDLAAHLEADSIAKPGTADRLGHWNPFDQNAAADFFDPEWMFQISTGFDITIGNPPFVRHEKFQQLKPILKEQYSCFTSTADLYVYFFEQAVRLLKPGGTFCFLSTNKWFRARYGGSLREWFVRNVRLRSIIDFADEHIFTAVAFPAITIAAKRKAPVKDVPKSEVFRALNWSEDHLVESLPHVYLSDSFAVAQSTLTTSGWQLEAPYKQQLLDRIRGAGTALGEYVNGRFYYGIKTGFNEAFVIDRIIRNKLITEDENSAKLIKPFLRGRDVKRWNVEYADQYLIKIESSENTTHPWSSLASTTAEKVFEKTYPAIYAHLSSFQGALISRYDKGHFYWELRACAYWDEFMQPKIILGRFMDRPTYVFDDKKYYTNDALYIIAGVDRFVVSILNSPVSWWFLTQTCTDLQNGYLQAFVRNQAPIPIPNATSQQKAILNTLVWLIESGVQKPKLEQLVNGLVYELFFRDDLRNAGIHLFDALVKAGFDKLIALKRLELSRVAEVIATRIFSNDHAIYAMLFNLQGLDVVRIIEGKE